MWSQIETLKKMQDYWKNQYTENLEKTAKLPFFNIHPYRPSKRIVAELKESVKKLKSCNPTTSLIKKT